MKSLKLTKIKSDIKRPKSQKRTLIALGLRKISSTNVIEASPQVIGMIEKVKHLISVEEVADKLEKKAKPAKAKAEIPVTKPEAKEDKEKKEKAEPDAKAEVVEEKAEKKATEKPEAEKKPANKKPAAKKPAAKKPAAKKPAVKKESGKDSEEKK